MPYKVYLLDLIEDHRCTEEDLKYLNDFIHYKKLDEEFQYFKKHAQFYTILADKILCTFSDHISILIFSSPPSTSGFPHLRLSRCSDTQQSFYQHSPISAPFTDHFSSCVNSPTNDFITRSVEYLLKPAILVPSLSTLS